MDNEEEKTPRGMLTHVGNWVLGRTLGRGAYAHVRLATHISGRQSACKILPALHWDTTRPKTWDEIVDAIEAHKEVVFLKALGGIKFDGVVELEGVIEIDGWTYIFSALQPMSLSQIRPPFPETELKKVFRNLCISLQSLHKLGISHEDLKRSNVLMGHDFKPVMIDFGFGHFTPNGGDVVSNGGTLDYTSPEKANEASYDPAANDVWSLGILLCKLLGVEHPFHLGEPDLLSTEARRRLKDEFPNHCDLYTKRLIVPSGPGVLIMNMLEKNPKKRLKLDDVIKHPYLKIADPDPPAFHPPPCTLPRWLRPPFPPSVIEDLCFLSYLLYEFRLCSSPKIIEEKLMSDEPCWEKRWATMLAGWVRKEDMDWEDVVKAPLSTPKRISNPTRPSLTAVSRREVLKEIQILTNLPSQHQFVTPKRQIISPLTQNRGREHDKENVNVRPSKVAKAAKQSEARPPKTNEPATKNLRPRSGQGGRVVKTTNTTIVRNPGPSNPGSPYVRRSHQKVKHSLVKTQHTSPLSRRSRPPLTPLHRKVDVEEWGLSKTRSNSGSLVRLNDESEDFATTRGQIKASQILELRRTDRNDATGSKGKPPRNGNDTESPTILRLTRENLMKLDSNRRRSIRLADRSNKKPKGLQ